MPQWTDTLPPEIAKQQTAWERHRQLLRLSECGVSKKQLQIFAGNVSQQFLDMMLRKARRRPTAPIEAWLQDDTAIQELARKLSKLARKTT